MSGGHFNYSDMRTMEEVFGYGVSSWYGLGCKEHLRDAKIARKLDPMEDKQLSELVYDVLCLLHSLDWYQSGDTGENTYYADVAYFKNKWLKANPEELTRREIDQSIEEVRKELLDTLLPEQRKGEPEY